MYVSRRRTVLMFSFSSSSSARFQNLSLLTHYNRSRLNIDGNDSDAANISAFWKHFMHWFPPFLGVFAVFIALACPFLLWILQERCFDHSSASHAHPSVTVIATPRLLPVDPPTGFPFKSPSITTSLYQSPASIYSTQQESSYHTPLIFYSRSEYPV